MSRRAATPGSRVTTSVASPASTPAATPKPAITTATKLTRLVTRNSATVRLAANERGTPLRSSSTAPTARPPAPPDGSTTFSPCTAIDMLVLARRLVRRSYTPWNARAKHAVEASSRSRATAIQPPSAPAS
jgi:hypothetical protein